MMSKRFRIVVPFLAAVAVSAGCDRTPPDTKPSAASASSETLPTGLFASIPADGALSVLETKSGAKQGETVLVRGRIGGSGSPFVNERAMFTIVDASLLACSDTPGDGCKTPWDYCCEPAADIARHAATVRVVGKGGDPLHLTLKGQGGLSELSAVLVRGTVVQNDGMVLILDAEEISTEK